LFLDVPFWGHLPLDQNLLEACENGKCFFDNHLGAAAVEVLKTFAKSNTVLPVDMPMEGYDDHRPFTEENEEELAPFS
jgi:hypothetical protein